MTAGLVWARLRARGAALAARLVAQARARALDGAEDGQARFGRRDALADPRQLWPGDGR